MADTVVIKDKRFINISGKIGEEPDGLQIWGPYDWKGVNEDGTPNCTYNPNKPNNYIIENCYFDNSGVDPKYADEAISIIWGANAIIRNCYIKNWGKGLLIGNGDAPKSIDENMRIIIENCIFEGNSRRNPYIKYATVHMKNCLIKNWGETFYLKSHGIRVAEESHLYLENCVFWQDSFFYPSVKQFFEDCIHQPVDLSTALSIFKPGITRGVYTEHGGKVEQLKHCFKNQWWISLVGKHEDPMSGKEAEDLIKQLYATVPH